MRNAEVAKLFYEIGALLEIKNENPFKVKAYQRAGQVIESLTEDIEEIYREGRLRQIPGVGSSIAEKIEEYFNTGKCQYHQDLLKEIPRGLLDILSIPEVGPKTAQLVYKTLGIQSIEELEKACKEGKLASLPGLGKKTQENILQGIELMRRQKGRVPIWVALPFAKSVVDILKQLPEVEQIEISGSLRRFKETIGDIDILVTSRNPQKVMETFTNQPYVERIIAKGTTKSSILASAGATTVQMDVRVVDPGSFGAAVQYFTGSKEHNIKLREMASKRGLKISEYGVFRTENEEKIAGDTEVGVYATLDLPWIPPELREDLGEVEAAQKNSLPNLIQLADIKGDLHVHTNWTDGGHSIEQMVEAAKERGYEYIGICDHSKGLGVTGGLSDEELLQQIDKIRRLNEKLDDFRILAGCEVNIRADGSLDYPDEILDKLDFVIAAIHSGFKMDAHKMTERIITAMKNPYVNIIAHPTGRLIGKRDPYQVDIDRLMEAAVKYKVALEINAFPERLDLRDIHAKKAKELGIPIVINTDAHNIMHLELIVYGVATARRGWLEPKDVINTLPLPELIKVFSKK